METAQRFKHYLTKMASDILSEIGIFVDDLNNVRLLDPVTAEETKDLQSQFNEFLHRIDEFHGIVERFIDVSDRLAKEVESEKMKAIGSRNRLKSAAAARETKKEQMEALLMEKQVQAQRLQVRLQSLQREENELNESMAQLVDN